MKWSTLLIAAQRRSSLSLLASDAWPCPSVVSASVSPELYFVVYNGSCSWTASEIQAGSSECFAISSNATLLDDFPLSTRSQLVQRNHSYNCCRGEVARGKFRHLSTTDENLGLEESDSGAKSSSSLAICYWSGWWLELVIKELGVEMAEGWTGSVCLVKWDGSRWGCLLLLDRITFPHCHGR